MSWVFHHVQKATAGFQWRQLKKETSHPLTHLHGDLSYGPGGVVTHRDELWVQVEPQDGHELSWGGSQSTRWSHYESTHKQRKQDSALTSAGFHVEEAGLCQVTEQRKGTLSDFRHRVLQHKRTAC